MNRSCVILLMLIFFSLPLEAQLYKPFASFRVIKTDRFDIIFPPESEPSARLLASYADRVYKDLSSLFGIEVPGRIPVTFAPHTDMFNGFYNPVPYPHIVLYDTPMDLEWTNFANNLEGLFIHELTHAVSLNTRGPFFRALRTVFGNWVTPSALNAPAFMVEGVTVAMESMTGFGRANDPLIKQELRQAIHEGKFLTPFQASGVYDRPNQSGAYYEYGGLFSSWLIQTYGIDKYTELWRAMGERFYISFFVYRSDYFRIFKNVYKIDFLDAWKAFSVSLELSGLVNEGEPPAINALEENTDELLPEQYHFFSKSRSSIAAITAGKKEIFVLDSYSDKILVYDIKTEKVRDFNSDSFFSYDIDVSADNKTLLVSGYQMTGKRYSAIVTEQRSDSGWKTGRSIRGLYKARYFRDGVIGLRSQLHNNNIVYEDFNGNTEILFRGNEELIFSGPQVLDNERIVFIAAREGERELVLYNYETGEIFRIESISNDKDQSALSFWRYARCLNVSEGKILFSHNINDRMYKLASVDLETMQAFFSNRDFSGGVFYPVSADNTVYYRAAFFSGDGFLRFPEPRGAISGTVVNINLVKQSRDKYGFIGDNAEKSFLNPEPENEDLNTLSASSVLTANIEEAALPAQASASQLSRPYFGITYMNPFKLWLPLPLLRFTFGNDDEISLNLDGGGLFTVMMDPTDRNLIIAFAYADFKYQMAMIDNFTWQTTVTGFPILLEFSDKVFDDFIFDPYRETRINLSGSFNHYPGRWGYGISLSAGYVRIANKEDSKNNVSAYEWKETEAALFITTGLTFSNLQRGQDEIFGDGVSFSLRGSSSVWASSMKDFKPRVEGLFRSSAETRFPLNLSLYGAYDLTGMNIHGASNVYGTPLFDNYASKEYQVLQGLNLIWLAGCELSIALFSIEIQNNLGHGYYNRFFGSLALRNVIYDGQDFPGAEGLEINNIRLAQSLVLNLKLVASLIPIKSLPVFLEPHLWGAWKFSNAITGEGSLWELGVGFNYRY